MDLVINNRPIPTIKFEKTHYFPLKTPHIVKRVVTVAIPFFMLFQSTALVVTGALGACRVWQHLRKSEYREACLKAVIIGLCIFQPAIGITCSYVHDIISYVHSTSKHDKEVDILNVGLIYTVNATHIISLFCATPITVAISLIARAVGELRMAEQQYHEKKYLECTGNIVLAALRIGFAGRELTPIFRKIYDAMPDLTIDLTIRLPKFNSPEERVAYIRKLQSENRILTETNRRMRDNLERTRASYRRR